MASSEGTGKLPSPCQHTTQPVVVAPPDGGAKLRRSVIIRNVHYVVAVDAVERDRWLGMVQDHLPREIVPTAYALSRFVNRREFGAFPGHMALASKAQVNERTARRHLEMLETAGAIVRRQRRRSAAVIHLVAQDWTCMSGFKSSPMSGLKSARADACDRQDRTSVSRKTGHSCFGNDVKSNKCATVTQRLISETYLDTPPDGPNMTRLRGFNGLSPGPDEGDEIIIDDGPLSIPPPPPPDMARLRAFAADELSRTEPPGWREHIEAMGDS